MNTAINHFMQFTSGTALLALTALGCGVNQAGVDAPTEQSSAPASGAVDNATSQSVTLQADGSIKLLPPRKSAGRPLLDVLADRKTHRRFDDDRELSLQHLSELVWAATGINRRDTGKRTAPTAMNLQEIDVYVALELGLFLYDAEANLLKKVMTEDIRRHTGKQRLTQSAPADLVFVADFDRMEDLNEADKAFYSATDTGFISQNVYLYCASEGLATVVIGYLDRSDLANTMKLRPQQKVILSQAVGYPRQ